MVYYICMGLTRLIVQGTFLKVDGVKYLKMLPVKLQFYEICEFDTFFVQFYSSIDVFHHSTVIQFSLQLTKHI